MLVQVWLKLIKEQASGQSNRIACIYCAVSSNAIILKLHSFNTLNSESKFTIQEAN